MNVHKEVDIKEPLYSAKLENGVFIFVYGGYAEGSDGNIYYHIGTEDSEGDLQTLGWSCDVKEAKII